MNSCRQLGIRHAGEYETRSTMARLEWTIGRIEVHLRALAAAAAQAQMAMQSTPATRAGQGEHGWTERYDALARNLADPGLCEHAALRRMLHCKNAESNQAED